MLSSCRKLGRHWKWLQLLCLEEEILRKADSQYGEVVLIPDDAWQKAHIFASSLKIQYAISMGILHNYYPYVSVLNSYAITANGSNFAVGVPKYDVHKRFFTKNTRIHTFALSTGIDLRFRQPWYLNCTIKTLYTWYSSSLGS